MVVSTLVAARLLSATERTVPATPITAGSTLPGSLRNEDTWRLDAWELRGISESGADPVKIQSSVSDQRGRRAVRIVNEEGPSAGTSGTQVLAIVHSSDFHDGTNELEAAGLPRPGAKPGTRGCVGIALRVREGEPRYEALHLRLTNGRAEDRLQRNHSAQYLCGPDYPSDRPRGRNPGHYESYVDLDAGAWTQVKIVVPGSKATFRLNGADQPCLIVKDLKQAETRGKVAHWSGSETDAYL